MIVRRRGLRVTKRSTMALPRPFGIEAQIAHGAAARFDGADAGEAAAQRQGEEADAGIEIERGFAFGTGERGIHQLVGEEAIHLKKRITADAETSAVIERA